MCVPHGVCVGFGQQEKHRPVEALFMRHLTLGVNLERRVGQDGGMETRMLASLKSGSSCASNTCATRTSPSCDRALLDQASCYPPCLLLTLQSV